MNKVIYLSLLVCALLAGPGTDVLAQGTAFPVTAAVRSLPPFTPTLADWVDPVNNRLGAVLLLNDRREAGFQVRLRVTVSGGGITLTTKPEYQPVPIPLSFGIPTEISAIDLAPYLNVENLNFTGYSAQAYFDNGGLPDGTYSICVEAFDYNRINDQPVSQRACTFVRAALLDPPVVVNPIGVQTPISPQNLFVQWQARHTASFATNYRVQIYQVDPSTPLTAEQIYALQQPYVETETNGMTSVNFDAAFPTLERGSKYLLRVQARDPMGSGVFKNDGFSAPVFFDYGKACASPQSVEVDVQGYDRARVNFAFESGVENYVLRYREAGRNGNWYENEVTTNFVDLEELVDSSTYEIQLQSVCGGTPGSFGEAFSFTTDARPFDPSTFECGDDIAELPMPTNTTPLENLQLRTYVQVGQFPMLVTYIDGDAGGWSGAGQIYVDWLGQKFNVSFQGILINTDKVMYEGEVKVYDKGLGSVPGMLSLDEVMEQLDTAATSFCGLQIDTSQTVEAPNMWNGRDSTGMTRHDSARTRQYVSSLGSFSAESEDPDYYEVPDSDSLFVFAGGNDLPFVVGTAPNTVAFFGMRFTPSGARVNAYMSGAMGSRTVAFGAIDVGFQRGGLQGENKLQLLSNISFPYGDAMLLSLAGGDDTFISFTCKGIEQVSVKMKVEVCDRIAQPVDEQNYEVDSSAAVTGTFTAVSGGWGEFAGTISISPFQLPSLPGWAFSVQNAVFDFADDYTPDVVQFPDDYTHAAVSGNAGADSPLWKGFYLESARVKVPGTFLKDSTSVITIGAANLIIDNTGFTGEVYGSRVVSLDTGRVSSWGLSLDSVAIAIQSNQFRYASIGGLVDVPALDVPLGFEAHIEPGGRYAFKVNIEDTVRMSAFVADVELREDTEIGIEYDRKEKKFKAHAILHGTMSMAAPLSKTDTTVTQRQRDAGYSPSRRMAADSSKSINLTQLDFEGFHLSTESPYLVDIGNWDLQTEKSGMKGFPFTIKEASMMKKEKDEGGFEVAFGMSVVVNLVKSADNGFGAEGRVFIICDIDINPETKKQTWKFNRVRLDRLAVDYVGGGFALRGLIEQYEEHPVYGSGFQGGIQATFTPNISVGAVAMFGKKDDFRYFFADARLAFTPGIVIGATGMAIYGFGGGISYHMDRTGVGDIQLPETVALSVAVKDSTTQDTTSLMPPPPPPPGGPPPNLSQQEIDSLRIAYEAGVDPRANEPPVVPLPGELGKSLSGVTYIPDKSAGIGLKAMVAFGAVNRELFNGDITFEILFNSGGGVRKIGLLGNLNFATPPKTPDNPTPDPAVAFYADMVYNFEEKSFDALLRATVNAGPIRGAYPNNVAGSGVIHADPEDWYVYLGTPTQPIKLSYDLKAMKNAKAEKNKETLAQRSQNPPDTLGGRSPAALDTTGMATELGLLMTAYLDAGTKLPDFPLPPERVRNILGNDADYKIARDDPAFADAGGILFGAGLELSMPELTFLIFYAEMYAGLGFDMMLKNYGSKARCAQDLDSGKPIGMNGWYATGQLWAYLEAKVGIKINFLGIKGKYEILNVAVAALLQARLPNPMWMKGQIAGRYAILGGKIKGNCRFEFEAGSQCDIVPTGTEDVLVIENLVPSQSAKEVSVFNSPQALFSIPMSTGIPLRDDEASRYFEVKAELDEAIVTVAKTGEQIPGKLDWNESRAVVAFRPTDILPGETEFAFSAKATVLQRKAGSLTYVAENISGRAEPVQRESVTFKTGKAPDVISEENVEYSYPMRRQVNFLRGEHGQGYVQLLQGQDYLFFGGSGNKLEAAEWKQVARFYQRGRPVAETTLSYDGEINRVSFPIPSAQLEPGLVSYLEILNVPLSTGGNADANVEITYQQAHNNLGNGQEVSAEDAQVLISSKETTGELKGLKEKILYRIDFRTSQYERFADKVAALRVDYNFTNPHALTTPDTTLLENGEVFIGPYLSISDFGVAAQTNEDFDLYELDGFIDGSYAVDPLIRGRARLDETSDNWYRNYPDRYVYSRFPLINPPMDIYWRPTGQDDLSYEEVKELDADMIDNFGYPPDRAISLENPFRSGATLSDGNIKTANYLPRSEPVAISYELPYLMYRDHADFWNQMANYVRNNDPPPGFEEWLEWKFVYPDYGNYSVDLEYYLPGTRVPSSTARFVLPYNVNDTTKKK